MRRKGLITMMAPAALLVAGVAALALSLSVRVPSVAASNGGSGQLHVTKNCSNYTGLAGSYCTVMSSNLPEIPAGSTVFYTQAATAAPEQAALE